MINPKIFQLFFLECSSSEALQRQRIEIERDRRLKMRPFGNDITNIANNGGTAGNGEDRQNGNGNNGNHNGNGNGNGSGSGSDNSEDFDNSGNEVTLQSDETDPRLPPHIARIGGIMTFSPIAGRGVIRVVRRCEDAKENHKLGELVPQ